MRRLGYLVAWLSIAVVLGACTGATDEGEPNAPGLDELFAKSDKVEGMLTLLRDRKTGSLSLLLSQEQLGREFVYHSHIVDGVAALGLFRGSFSEGRIVTFRRHFDRIEIVQRNTSFYFDPASPLSRAAQANRPDAVLAAQKILSEGDAGIVIELGDVLLKEVLRQIKPTPDPQAKPGDRFVLGKLSETRNKFIDVRSYPANTEVVVEYVYEDQAPVVVGGSDVTNSRAVSIQVQHSFIAMPDNNYQPRFNDYRVGYFTDQVTDLTSDSHTPYRDLIRRWHLEKKNPAAFVSDPVEPITFWIENTTPLEFRDIIREAALAWNSSFAKAGISNAVEVRVQPDDAEWDAGDIRYNVLRWTSSPNPPFGGMGPSFTNPRTGQILGADIMLEYSFVTSYRRAQELLQPRDVGAQGCMLADAMQENYQFARLALDVQGVDEALQDQLLHDALSMLILHEIGHSLGLNHNMKASQLQADPFDKAKVEMEGLSASVMDYEAVNVAPPGREQTLFFQSRPGPYDDWAIEFGYSAALPDADEEQERLENILSRSVEPELAFGNDADDMRAPGNGVDPRVNIWDMSGDAIGYAQNRFEHLKAIQQSMIDQYDHYESWHPLRQAQLALTNQRNQAARVVASYVGGIYVDRLPPATGRPPYTPVALEQQERAMRVLGEYVFSDDPFGTEEIFRRMQPQRRGFEFFGNPEDPKLHQSVLAVQQQVLGFLLNPVALQRITDTRLYGNAYDVASMLGDLTDYIFADDLRGNVSTQRQNLQVEYTTMLTKMLKGAESASVDHVARSAVHFQLERIGEWMDRKRGGNDETKAHTGHLQWLIEQALAVQA